MYRVQFCNIFSSDFYTVSFNLGEDTVQKFNAYFGHILPLLWVFSFSAFPLFFLLLYPCHLEIVTVNALLLKRTFSVGSSYFYMSYCEVVNGTLSFQYNTMMSV